MRHGNIFSAPVSLFILTALIYYQFFIFGKIPIPADTLIGAYFPYLDYKWGYEVGVPIKNALISDVFSQFFIWKYLAIDLFSKGEIPLWNIYSFSGNPLLATYHSAVLNPFNLLLFLPKFSGWGIYIFMQTFIAALGLFYLLKNYNVPKTASITGSLVFAFSGLMTTWVEFGTGVYAAAFLPWIFLFLDKYLSSLKIRYLFLMQLSFILLYLSGHAQLTLYSTILGGVYLSVKYFEFRDLKKFLLPLVFIFLSIGVSSVQFLPSYDFTSESIRDSEAYSTQFNYGLNPIYEAVRFFAADFFGNPSTYNHWDNQSYHEQSIFLGTITLPLILPLFFRRFRGKNISFFFYLFCISIFLGFDNFLTRFLYSLPLQFLTYSSASRIFFLTSFSAGILTGYGIYKMQNSNEYLGFVRGAALGLFILISSLLIGFFLSKEFIEGSMYSVNFAVTSKNLILPFVLILFFLIILYIKQFKKYLVVLILLITFFDLGRYFLKYNPFVNSNLIFPETPFINEIKNKPGLFRIARADGEILPPNTWTFYKLQSVEGYDPLVLESYNRYFNKVNGYPLNVTTSRYVELDNYPSAYLDVLNTKYILAVKRDIKGDVAKGNLLNEKITKSNYKKIYEDKTSVLLENPNALERGFFIENVIKVDSFDEMKKVISESGFNPRKTAVALTSDNLPEKLTTGQIEITSYLANRVLFKTKSEDNAFLIFTDSYEKGWKLKRNGIEEKIYQTNLALRGILIPGGENYFEMYYSPDSFVWGWKLSGLFIFLTISIILLNGRKKLFDL